MRALALTLLTATGLALSFPGLALAADAAVPTQRCGPGQVWDGYDCVRTAPRVRAPEPEYVEAEPDYPEYYLEPAEVARPVYVAPPVYIGRPYYAPRPIYAAPYYGRPYVRHYAPARYGWGYHRPWRRHAWR